MISSGLFRDETISSTKTLWRRGYMEKKSSMVTICTAAVAAEVAAFGL